MNHLQKSSAAILINALAIFSLSSLVQCKAKDPEEKVNDAVKVEHTVSFNAQQMQQIKVEQVTSTHFAEEFAVVGDISFDENNVVRIYPIVSGSVERVDVSLGDYVTRGRLLATILSTDITSFQRDYNVAKSNLELAEKNFARSQELFNSLMMSEKDFAESKKDFENAKSEFNEKKQILELYGGSTERLDALFRVVAPRSGYIVERNINEGTQIRTDNNTTLFTISDLKTVWIWANVHESDLGKVQVGDRVTVTTIAFPDRVYKGNIQKIGTMLDPASRIIRIRTELENEDGLLKPEMFATVTITSQRNERVIVVPTRALVLENNNYFVMREVGPKTYEKVPVTIGKKFSNMAEIISGLAEGDLVITEGALFAVAAFNLK